MDLFNKNEFPIIENLQILLQPEILLFLQDFFNKYAHSFLVQKEGNLSPTNTSEEE